VCVCRKAHKERVTSREVNSVTKKRFLTSSEYMNSNILSNTLVLIDVNGCAMS